MFKHYTPSENELAMLKYKSFLYYQGDREDIPDQETLTGYLVKAIRNFDYFYTYSDSLSTWRAGEGNHSWITKHINKIDDAVIRSHLTHCFHHERAEQVGDIFPWGKYINRTTPFVGRVFAGNNIEQACYLTGLSEWIDELNAKVRNAGVSNRVIYSDNYATASKILKEGVYWFDSDHPLQPVAVPADLYSEIEHLGKLYKSNEIKFTDLKSIKPLTIQAMLDGKAEVIMIGNFYMVFTYQSKHTTY